jgi:peptidoglycan/LPS O-acetylase OafA/YrhL
VNTVNNEDHLPAFDGLRAVAVVVVVVFHVGIEELSGGSIGFAVAYVLSGYLVTSTLAARLETGRPIRWGRYFVRRGERLLPAHLAAGVVSVLVLRWVITPDARELAAEGYRAGLLLVGNWQLIADSPGPVGDAVPAGAGQHLWAVGVLAQFTVVWPLLLTVLHRVGGRLRWSTEASVRSMVLVLALGSTALALWMAGENEARAFYGTDTRAHQFLFGALLALAPLRVGQVLKRRRALASGLNLLAVGGSVLLATDLVPLGPVPRGTIAAVAAVVVLAAVERSAGLLRGALGATPLPYLGRISHATFLWHWPVIVVLAEVAPEAQRYQVAILALLVGAGLAALTHELLERPFQAQIDFTTGRSALAGCVAVLVLFFGVVVVSPALEPGAGSSTTASESVVDAFSPVPRDLDLDAESLVAAADDAAVDCIDEPVEACTIVEGEGPHLLLLGDGLAVPLIPALEEIARSRGLQLSVVLVPGCPWQEGVDFPNTGALHPCDTATADVYGRILPGLDPDVVVVSSAFLTITPDVTDFDPADTLASALRSQTPVSVDRLRALADHVVLLDPTPMAPADPLSCLALADWLEDCRFVVRDDDPWVEAAYRELAEARSGVSVVDIDPLVCPYLPICDPVIGGQVVRRDALHLTQGFGATLADPIGELLDARGLFEEE